MVNVNNFINRPKLTGEEKAKIKSKKVQASILKNKLGEYRNTYKDKDLEEIEFGILKKSHLVLTELAEITNEIKDRNLNWDETKELDLAKDKCWSVIGYINGEDL